MTREQEEKTRKIRRQVELLQYEYNEREREIQIQLTETIQQYSSGGICHVLLKISTIGREQGIPNRGIKQYKYVYTESIEREMRKDIERWYCQYYGIKKLNEEIAEINEIMLELTGDIIRIQYELGNGYREITDTSLVVGVNKGKIARIKKTGLFEGTGETEIAKMTLQNLRNWIKYAMSPAKLIKIKEPILEDLCIYTRKTVPTAIRGTVDMRVKNIVNREELYEDKEIIAIICREIRTKEEVELARQEVKEGLKPCINLERVEELPQGIHIEYKYKLKPIYKRSLEQSKRDVIPEIRG